MKEAKPNWNKKRKIWSIRAYDGQRCIKTFYSSDKKRGDQIVKEKLHRWIANGMKDPQGTIGSLWERYLEFYSDVGTGAKKNKKTIFTQYIRPEIGSIKVENIKRNHFEAIIRKQSRRGLSRKTLQNIRGEMLAFRKWCSGEEIYIPDLSSISIPASARNKGKSIIPDDALKTLFDSSYDDARSVNYFRFLYLIGCRPGEGAGLQWDDIDFEAKQLSFNRSLNRMGEETKGKNENALRTIDISDRVIDVLRMQRDIQVAAGIKSKWVFAYDDKPPKQARLYKHWHGNDREMGKPHTPGLADRLGCQGTSLYCFRHTFVSHCQAAGIEMSTIQRYIGHSSSMNTSLILIICILM